LRLGAKATLKVPSSPQAQELRCEELTIRTACDNDDFAGEIRDLGIWVEVLWHVGRMLEVCVLFLVSGGDSCDGLLVEKGGDILRRSHDVGFYVLLGY
jgi:hypothetical protein